MKVTPANQNEIRDFFLIRTKAPIYLKIEKRLALPDDKMVEIDQFPPKRRGGKEVIYTSKLMARQAGYRHR